MGGIYNDPANPPRMRFIGGDELCKPHIKEARRFLQKYMEQSNTNGLDVRVGQHRKILPDGTKIKVGSDLHSLYLEIDVTQLIPPPPKQASFQCDLYQDDPEFPEDITKQVKTSIWFSVHDTVSWKTIDERHGNYEWKGDTGLVTWDSTQNWGRGILNKKSWNDAIYGPNGEAVGWPYNPRPEHVFRDGEITTIVNNYPTSNTDFTDKALFSLNFKAVFEPGDQVQKQILFINNIKYSPNFDANNQFILGACTHKMDSGKIWCVVVTQNFNPTVGSVGLAYSYEDVWYFEVTDNLNPTPIKIHTMYYTNPQEDNYITNKSDITSWAFTKTGLTGKAYRSEQYFVGDILSYGPYSDPRFIDLSLTYTNDDVTATSSKDTSVTVAASEIIEGGAKLSPEEEEDWIATYIAWMNDLNTQLNFPTDKIYGPLDIEYSESKLYGFGVSRIITDDELSGFPDRHIYRTVEMRITNGASIIWSTTYSGDIYTDAHWDDVNEKWITENEQRKAYDPIGMFYIGGSALRNIAFFVKVSIEGAMHQNVNYVGDDTNMDSSYVISLQLICIFKGAETDIGSKITYTIPSRFDDEKANASNEIFVLGNDPGDSGLHGLGSHFYWSPIEAGGTYFEFVAASSSTVLVGDFGGSFRCAPDGSHAVISCSYMDIAKYLYPWHRYSWDVNTTSKVNRMDTMNLLGVPQNLQDAWNKYMLNYAIIENDGEIVVKQLSNILFGKKVISDPLFVDPITGEEEYEHGIKEKDTTAFLPIGLHAGENVNG